MEEDIPNVSVWMTLTEAEQHEYRPILVRKLINYSLTLPVDITISETSSIDELYSTYQNAMKLRQEIERIWEVVEKSMKEKYPEGW